MNKPRISFVTRAEFYPNLVSVMTNLTLMLKDDFDLRIIMGKNNTIPSVLADNCKIIEVDTPRFNFQNLGYSYLAVKAALNNGGTDVIVSITQPYPIGMISCLVAGARKDTAVVIRITGDFFHEKDLVKGVVKRLYKKYIYEKLLLGAMRKATIILPIGKNLEKKFLLKDFPPEKLVTLAQPFSSEQFVPPSTEYQYKQELKKLLGLDINKKTILFVARLEPNKGIDKLKLIIDGVLKKSNKFQFCIIGKGSASYEFDSYNKKDVHLTGFIKRDNLPQYYHCADLIAYPTSKDASPTVLLEALAAGLPILATPVGDIPNLTKNTRESTEEFIQYILEENYILDKTPVWFDWHVQKQMYVQVIYDALSKINIVSNLKKMSES